MSQPLPYAVVLGTVQDGGFPHVGCACEACRIVADKPKRHRRVASLGLVSSGGLALIDATPNLATQWRTLAETAGRSIAEPPAAVLLTHLHAGHVMGLPLFGREGWAVREIPLWATDASLKGLQENEPFRRLFSEHHFVARPFSLGWDRSLGEIQVQPIPVHHRSEWGDTVAYRIDGPESSLLYAPDLDALTPEVMAQIRAVDVALLDGTFFRRAELRREDAAEIPHPAITETMTQVANLDTKIVFTHLNHTNPVLDPESRESRALLGVGMRIAEEGEVFALGGPASA